MGFSSSVLTYLFILFLTSCLGSCIVDISGVPRILGALSLTVFPTHVLHYSLWRSCAVKHIPWAWNPQEPLIFTLWPVIFL